ncbi:MAG TPA: peptidyl-prolyl cis-trans isomerase [Sphingomicrobium sp.]|nr:peptidyl-prolyl cis-trans isomerase [Sphingomicrobium sp.]
MLSAFRSLSKSAFGSIILVLFLLAIAASFALADVANVRTGTFGFGPSGLAEVGGEEITDRDMDTAMRQVLQQAQQQNPEATYSTIGDQFDPVLEQLINERAILAFAKDHGFHVSKRLIDGQIAGLPQTRGLDGRFSEQAYAQFLQQQQLTDAELRRVFQSALAERLMLAPAAVDPRVPIGVARPYASMLLEQREGQMGLVPTDAFRTGLNPTDGDLQSFYSQNRQRYMVPEQRVLKLARFGPEAVANIAPTEAEIAQYYRSNQATYAGSETRVISQAVVQDKGQADGIAARARSGAAFATAAAPAGLAPEDVNLGSQTQAQFSGVANDAVANAAFAAAKGAIVGPIRSDLGWHVIKIEDVRGASGRTLEQARGEIAAELTASKRKEALTDLVTRVEDQILDGASFNEVVAAARIPVTTTPAINSAGIARANASFRMPEGYEPVLKTGFAMGADEDAEVVTLAGDAGYVIVAVDRVIDSAPAPLAEIKARVRDDWINRKANDRARAIATEIANKVARGVPMDKAMDEAGVPLPPVQPMAARRLQISQANAEAIVPLRMLFTLTQGKSRLVADPRGRGFFIIKTNKIVPGNSMNSPLLIAQTQAEFQQAASNELGQQMLAAMKADQGVERNEEMIAASKRRITGAGQ